VIISKIIDNVKGYVYSLKLNIIFWNHYQSARMVDCVCFCNCCFKVLFKTNK